MTFVEVDNPLKENNKHLIGKNNRMSIIFSVNYCSLEQN